MSYTVSESRLTPTMCQVPGLMPLQIRTEPYAD